MSRHAIAAKTATTVTIGSNTLLAFVGTDYLGMSEHTQVQAACREGIARYGISASASRVTSGTVEAHQHLEEALAEFLGLESALVLPSGELANLALLESLKDGTERILIDADAHSSLLHAAQAHGAPRLDYGSGDPTRLLALCDRFRHQQVAILTDGVFPAKGRLAPVADILRYMPNDALVLLDDSHGIGVLHPSGKGTLEAFGTATSQVVLSFSLGKALGASGGALVGPADRIEAVRNRSETYRGSTALAPSLAMAARASIEVLQAEPDRVIRLHRNTRRLHRIASGLGQQPHGSFLPVWNRTFLDPEKGMHWHTELLRSGIYVPFSIYGDNLGGALRFSVCSEHTAEDLERLRQALQALSR